MLSKKDNETLVHIGPDTVMGRFFRLFWIPFLPSLDLEADGRPKRVRLLGEDLVAFRTSDGTVGLLDAACAHRRAPLAYGRNEECGLRCVYHGWKFNVAGEVLDMPSESNKRAMKMVRIKAYPCVERNGIVWAYMGPQEHAPPPLPNMEWNLVPAEQAMVTFRVQPSNWLQALEGDIDSAHAALLHGRIDSQGIFSNLTAGQDLTPTFEVVNEDFGLSIASIRKLKSGDQYVRVNQLVLPFFTFVPPQSQFPELTGHAWVPMDDEHVLVIMFSYHPSEPLDPRTVRLYEQGHKGRETGHASQNAYIKGPPGAPFEGYWTKFHRDNDFMFDYELQENTWYSGIPGLWVQDVACQAGITPIADRTQEHLFSSDTGIVHARRLLLNQARAYDAEGATPGLLSNPEVTMMRPVSLTLAAEADWKDSRDTVMRARLGAGFGYTP